MKAPKSISSKKDWQKYPFRVRLAGEIVAEIVLPLRQTGKIAIIASGLPSSPSKGELLHFLANQGYVAVSPRYRGTWESGGIFLKRSPTQDITDTIDTLASGRQSFIDLATGEPFSLWAKTFHLFGFSFGGPAVVLNSAHPLVSKVVAVSPVLDWTREGEDEPFEKHVLFVTAGFGGAFRVEHGRDWHKLLKPDFYNPLTQTGDIDGRKVFIIHARDDRVVPYKPVLEFMAETNATVYLKPHGGHHLRITHRFLWNKAAAFLSRR
ncbi:MAG: prolyl oligopeptidase family serine peptidase [Candidatus Moranbacteria bacterium]|nr:prolyl oligopeptidase family serine peptidase [Candidatus Moranbacteria bacterium]